MPGTLGGGIPVTYVPARNTLFLALALGWARWCEASDIFVGVNAVDVPAIRIAGRQFISLLSTARVANVPAWWGRRCASRRR